MVEQREYTRLEVARAAGVARNTLWRWERDGKVPSPPKRFRDGRRIYGERERQAAIAYAQKMERPAKRGAEAVRK